MKEETLINIFNVVKIEDIGITEDQLIELKDRILFLMDGLWDKEKKVSTFKLFNCGDGTEIGKPIEELRSEAFKLYEKFRLYDKIDKEEIRKFLLEVYMMND